MFTSEKNIVTIWSTFSHIINVSISTALLFVPSLGHKMTEYVLSQTTEITINLLHNGNLQTQYRVAQPIIEDALLKAFTHVGTHSQMQFSVHTIFVSTLTENFAFTPMPSSPPPSFSLSLAEQTSDTSSSEKIYRILEMALISDIANIQPIEPHYPSRILSEYQHEMKKTELYNMKKNAIDLFVINEKGKLHDHNAYMLSFRNGITDGMCIVKYFRYPKPSDVIAVNLGGLFLYESNARFDFGIDDFINQLKQMHNLQYLNISNFEFLKHEFDSFVDAIKELEHLHTLHIHSVTVDSRVLKQYPELDQRVSVQYGRSPELRTQVSLYANPESF